MEIKEKIETILLNLGFDPACNGFQYWIDSIYYVYYLKGPTKNSRYFMEDVYKFVANLNNELGINPRSIERCMRTSYKHSKEQIKYYFKYSGKITNKTLLVLIVNKLERVIDL